MNREEVAKLITEIAAVDHRSFSDADVLTWHNYVSDIDYDDARAAVHEHRRTNPNWLEIAHVVTGVKALREKRARESETTYEPVPDESVAEYLKRRASLSRAAASGNVIPLRPELPAGRPAQVPLEIAQIVRDLRESHHHPALRVRCPWCGAAPESWCERFTGATRASRKTVPGFYHPARAEASGVRFVPRVPGPASSDESEVG